MSERDDIPDLEAADETKKSPPAQPTMPDEQSESDLFEWTTDGSEQSPDEAAEESDESFEFSSQETAEELPDESEPLVETPRDTKRTRDSLDTRLRLAVTSEAATEREELKLIAEKSRKLRLLFQVSQNTLAKSLNQLAKRKYSNVTISNFEQNRLTLAKMRDVRLAIEPWFRQLDAAFAAGRTVDEFMAEIAHKHGNQSAAPMRSQKYKRVTPEQKLVLLKVFAERTHPKPERYVQLERQLGLDAKKIKNWFTNHRQHVRRVSSTGNANQPGCSRTS